MKNLFLFGLLFLVAWVPSHGQSRCISAVAVQGGSVVQSICVGQPIRFRDCSGTLMKEVYYDFDRKGEHQNFTDTTSFHTYAVPGTYMVSQFARDRQGIDDFFTRIFEVLPLPLRADQIPVLKSLTGAAEPAPGAYTLVLENLLAGYSYILETASGAGGTYIPLDTIRPAAAGTSTYVHPLSISGSTPCYRLRATGFCGGSPDVVSEILCAQPAVGIAENQRNRISWPPNPSPVLNGYTVLRNNESWGQFPATELAAQDGEVACGREYCYQVVALLTGGRSSASQPVCLRAISTTPPQIGVLHTTFNLENQVEATLLVSETENVREATLQRRLENGQFLEFQKSPDGKFNDPSVLDPTRSVCYQAFFQNSCGLASALSSVSCPMLLQATQLPDNSVRLVWTPWVTGTPNQPDPAITYAIELLDPDGMAYNRQELPAGLLTFTDPNPNQVFQTLRYRISATLPGGIPTSYSNIVPVERPFQVAIPNAFSPNNDGLNDVFAVKGKFIAAFKMTIYNTWGQLIFQSTDPGRGWDGRVNGRDAPVGAYAYTVEAYDSTGQKFTKTGTLTLIR